MYIGKRAIIRLCGEHIPVLVRVDDLRLVLVSSFALNLLAPSSRVVRLGTNVHVLMVAMLIKVFVFKAIAEGSLVLSIPSCNHLMILALLHINEGKLVFVLAGIEQVSEYWHYSSFLIYVYTCRCRVVKCAL